MLLLDNNGRILFTFIACLRPAFPKTSLCMLRPSLAAEWGSFFCLNLRCQITRFHLRQQHKKTTPYLLSGWGAVLPKPRANSFSDRSRWTSCPPRPFLSSFRPLLSLYTHAKSLFGSCRCPRLPIQRIFFSPAKILFFPPPKSLSLRLAPSSSSPDVGKFVCLCRQLAEYSLYALQGFFSPSIALLQTKSKHTAVPSLFKLKISSIRPVRSVSPLSHSH